MVIACKDVVRGVETYPSHIRHTGFCPGVHLGIPEIAVALVEVSGNIPGRYPVPPCQGTKQVGKILAYPFSAGYDFRQGGTHVRYPGLKIQVQVHPIVQLQQVVKNRLIRVEIIEFTGSSVNFVVRRKGS